MHDPTMVHRKPPTRPDRRVGARYPGPLPLASGDCPGTPTGPRSCAPTTPTWHKATRSAVVPAGTNYLHWEHAFGSASPTFDLELPGNAADAARFLSDSQRQVTQTLASLSESD